MYRLAPLTSRLRRRLGWPNDYRECHSRAWQVSPAIQTLVPAALFDPDDLARISGVFPTETIAGQIERLKAGPQQHRATMAYELRDAVLAQGHLFTRQVAHRLATAPLPLLAGHTSRHFREAALSSTHYGMRFFGHWLLDDLTLTLVAREIAAPISVLHAPSPHQKQYLDLFQLDGECVVDALFDRIVVIDDVGQNEHRRQRYEALRERARREKPGRHNRGVMLLRGTSGQRRMLTNESAVAQAVSERGFTVLDPLKNSAAELVAACLDAEVVIGVEGSQQAHGVLLMSPRGTLVELQPPTRFNVLYKDYCDCIGMRYAFIVGHPQGDDFFIDIPALHRLLDRTDRLQASSSG